MNAKTELKENRIHKCTFCLLYRMKQDCQQACCHQIWVFNLGLKWAKVNVSFMTCWVWSIVLMNKNEWTVTLCFTIIGTVRSFSSMTAHFIFTVSVCEFSLHPHRKLWLVLPEFLAVFSTPVLMGPEDMTWFDEFKHMNSYLPKTLGLLVLCKTCGNGYEIRCYFTNCLPPEKRSVNLADY